MLEEPSGKQKAGVFQSAPRIGAVRQAQVGRISLGEQAVVET